MIKLLSGNDHIMKYSFIIKRIYLIVLRDIKRQYRN